MKYIYALISFFEGIGVRNSIHLGAPKMWISFWYFDINIRVFSIAPSKVKDPWTIAILERQLKLSQSCKCNNYTYIYWEYLSKVQYCYLLLGAPIFFSSFTFIIIKSMKYNKPYSYAINIWVVWILFNKNNKKNIKLTINKKYIKVLRVKRIIYSSHKLIKIYF